MLRVIIASLLILVGCSEAESERFSMNVFIENNTSSALTNLIIRYRGGEIKVNSIQQKAIEKRVAYIGADTSFDITFEIKTKDINLKNVGYYYFNGNDNIRLIFNDKKLVVKVPDSEIFDNHLYE